MFFEILTYGDVDV